jgi:hypothetical protein
MQISRLLTVIALGATLATNAFASDADFNMVNRTGYQIDSVYVAPASSSEWGKDIMGRDALADGDKVAITFPHGGKACKFDIRVEYKDGDTAEWSNVDLCQYETITLFWDGKTTRAVGE